MKKRLLILAAAVLLALVLAVPASASKSVPIVATRKAGTWLSGDAKSVGNRCFIMNRWEDDIWDGAIQSPDGERELWTLQQGPCTPRPGFYTEIFRNEGFVTGTVLGRSGTFRYACQGKFYLDEPKRWEGHCLLYKGTGGLAGLHGRLQELTLLSDMGTTNYQGEIHFDPDK